MKKGTRAGQVYVEGTVNGDGMNEDIVREVEKAGPGVEKAGKEHGEGYGDEFSEGFFTRIKKKITAALQDDFGHAVRDEAGKTGTDSGEDFFANFTKSMERKVKDLDFDALKRGLANVGDDSGLDFADRFLNRLEARLGSGNGELATLFSNLEKKVSGNGVKKKDDDFGTKIGKLFGAGSRNNVLNIFGKSLGGIVSLADKARGGVSGLFSTFAKGFREVEEGSTIVQKLLGGFGKVGSEAGAGLSKAFSSLIASGPAAAVAVVVITAAMSALVSVAGALLGIITALVATIASALVGALAVAGAGIGALVVAAGLLTAAFMSMTDAQKKALKADFLPLRQEMIGLGQIIFKNLTPAFDTISTNLQKALYLATPLAATLGKAFGDAGIILSKSFSGPGFQAFSRSLSIYLPGIVRNLSAALGSFLNGALGLFSVIMPYVAQFSGYLADVAERFSRFANSAEGRNKIKDFVDRAVTSLLSLYGAVQQVFGFISDLLFSPEAQNAGNTIFDGIAQTFSDLRDNIAQAAADGSLQKFFDDAIQFGSQLWSVIQALVQAFISLYNSGVLQAVGDGLGGLAAVISTLSIIATPIVDLMGITMPAAFMLFKYGADLANTAVKQLSGPLSKVSGFVSRLGQQLGITSPQRRAASAYDGLSSSLQRTTSLFGLVAQAAQQANLTVAGGNDLAKPVPSSVNLPSLPKLQSIGASALAGTNIPKPKAPKQYHNPYEDYANSLIKSGPSVRTQIAQALASLNKQVVKAFADANKADTLAEARRSLSTIGKALTDQANSLVSSAQQAINSAASQLASASSAKDAARALAAVRAAQRDMAAAIAASKRLKAAQKIVAAQNIVSDVRVDKLLAGLKSKNATLADYAKAREKVAALLKDANDKLTDAIALRTDFAKAVTDSIKAFGALTQAQASTLNGVEGTLTANDITTTLQDRLDKIKAFQNNLLLLRAQGLSDSAYKQIVDAGVDGGSAYAQALIDGGIGSIQQVNSLVGQIDNLAGTLGEQTSSSLYDAGVNAAQGLVDGLTSLQAQINAAGEALGETIALAIKKKLGIHSPSRVLMADMDNVGDGAVIGLDNQHPKLVAASKRFADQIAISPEVAAYEAAQRRSGVSGNEGQGQLFGDLHVHTPTEDPMGVARETINELTGRLA